MSIAYQETTEGIGPDNLRGFFVGWPNRPSPVDHMAILRGSDLLVLALADRCKVVGFVTAITDGVSCAYIPHLEVLPEWQGKGIGTELMRRMMARLEAIRAIDLICDEYVRGFYERLGFKAGRGMFIRRHTGRLGAG